MHRLTVVEARRLAVRAQLLAAERPAGVLETVRALTLLQDDGTTAVAPSAHVVLWSRLGAAYDPRELAHALDTGTLVEISGMIRPAEDVRLYRADMLAWPGAQAPAWRRAQAAWVEANAACRVDLLERLELDGPLTWRELPDTCAVPWRSSGWNQGRNVGVLLELMAERGEVAVVGRRGRDRLWDLAERVYRDDPPLPPAEAARERDRRRLRALGIARARTTATPVEPDDVREAGEPAVVEGVRGTWHVDPELLDAPFRGRTALLSPLDRLVFDRRRMRELFAFDYALEMYKPAAARRWGYWAMPVLQDDALVGKVDATADPRAGVLRVDAVHLDAPHARRDAIDAELDDLAAWLELELVRTG